MDLALLDLGQSIRLEPRSALGLLWLQTHFEASAWDLIGSGRVFLSRGSCQELCRDAEAAGLTLSCVTAMLS